MSLLAALFLFGLIILFHEFGHFLFAKRGGIGVLEFSLGMGPRIFSFTRGGTKYSLKLLPFGGSCMMLGEDEDYPDKEAEENGEKHIAQKAAVLEVVEAAEQDAAKSGIGLDGTSKISTSNADTPDSMSESRQFPGSVGLTFNETSVWTRFLVIAAGPIFNFILAFFCAFLIIGYVGYDPAEIAQVTEGFPAMEAGMQPGDVITKVNDKNIKIYRDILAYTSFHQGEPLAIEYKRGDEIFKTSVTPKLSEETGSYLIGISGGIYKKPESVFVTARYSVYEVKYWIGLTFKSLGMIVKRQVTADDIAGPVRIVSMIDDTVKESSPYGPMVVLINLANLCIILSANLGVMNLLPIPALDGGRLVFILLEGVRGKPIDREKEGMIHMAGMALLMVLMVFILFNDVRNLL